MDRSTDPVKTFKVVCANFVSVGFDRQPDAVLHLQATKGKTCKETHFVQLTDEPYGTRKVQR